MWAHDYCRPNPKTEMFFVSSRSSLCAVYWNQVLSSWSSTNYIFIAYLGAASIRCVTVYMYVIVNSDALAQASDIRIERRQVVFLCWMQQSLLNRPISQMRTPLGACRELAVDYDTFPKLLYVFGHKRYSNRKETSCLPLLIAEFEPIGVSDICMHAATCPQNFTFIHIESEK